MHSSVMAGRFKRAREKRCQWSVDLRLVRARILQGSNDESSRGPIGRYRYEQSSYHPLTLHRIKRSSLKSTGSIVLIYPHSEGLYLLDKNSSPGIAMKSSHSWVVLWRPGTRYGPCWGLLCSHPNCNRIRCLASQICPFCNESLGYQSRLAEFSYEDFPAVMLCHLSCIEARDVGEGKKRDRPKAKVAM
jgi:hypothetical protein